RVLQSRRAGREEIGGRVEDFGRGEDGVVVAPAGDQHAAIGQQGGRVIGACSEGGGCDREGAGSGIKNLGLADGPAGVLAADEEDTAIGEQGGGVALAGYSQGRGAHHLGRGRQSERNGQQRDTHSQRGTVRPRFCQGPQQVGNVW